MKNDLYLYILYFLCIHDILPPHMPPSSCALFTVVQGIPRYNVYIIHIHTSYIHSTSCIFLIFDLFLCFVAVQRSTEITTKLQRYMNVTHIHILGYPIHTYIYMLIGCTTQEKSFLFAPVLPTTFSLKTFFTLCLQRCVSNPPT